jgi:hypothetical protein
MIEKRTKKNVYSERDYKIIKELYYLNKGKDKAARLPINDPRRINAKRINKQVRMSLRKGLSKIAALW